MSLAHLPQAARSREAAWPSDRRSPALAGQWELVRLAAQGSWARVFQARPAEGARSGQALYAVKLPHEHLANDPAAAAMLQREAAAGRDVRHPHLISILAAHVHGPPRYLVMPWLEGADLGRRLAAGERFGVPEALWLVRQAAQGLDALHAAGWLHGDVKPANMFVSRSRHVTLLDLGFARRRDEAGWQADRCVLGTVHYMAPEAIVSARGSDIRGDLYSLGVTLYRLLGGELPFPGRDVAEVVRRHRESRPKPLRTLNPLLPREAATLVSNLLAKEPLRRPQNPRELIERLVRLEIEALATR